MDRENAIICVQARQYMLTANFIVQSMAKERIHQLSQRKREQLTITVAKLLEKKHKLLKAMDIKVKLKEIAEQVYEETVMNLSSPTDSNGNLSDQVDDD